MKSFEMRVSSRRTVLGIERTPGIVTILSDCDLIDIGNVTFTIPLTAAEEIFAQARTRTIQEILPDLGPELREVFITGTSPAEFEQIRGIKPDLTLARYNGHYEVECPNCNQKARLLKRSGKTWRCPACLERR